MDEDHPVVRALLERCRADFAVTEVFRHHDGGWQRVHRQADPLVDRRPLTEVADLLS